MRYLVILLMVVLLPLRGWAGDSMATQMAGSQIAIESGASHAHETRAAVTSNRENKVNPDCHDAMYGQSATQETSSPAPNGDHSGNCQTCQACQACHTVALLPALLVVAGNVSSPQVRLTGTAFTSAAAALGQKPPIV